jgi:hypothetical protein
MFHIVDLILLVLYAASMGSAIYILAAHHTYFKERFKLGVVNLFMLAMLFFLSAYMIKMGVAVWIRASQVFGFRTPDVETSQMLAWMIAQIGTTFGLVSLAVLTYKKRFDLWVYLRKNDRKGERK